MTESQDNFIKTTEFSYYQRLLVRGERIFDMKVNANIVNRIPVRSSEECPLVMVIPQDYTNTYRNIKENLYRPALSKIGQQKLEFVRGQLISAEPVEVEYRIVRGQDGNPRLMSWKPYRQEQQEKFRNIYQESFPLSLNSKFIDNGDKPIPMAKSKIIISSQELAEAVISENISHQVMVDDKLFKPCLPPALYFNETLKKFYWSDSPPYRTYFYNYHVHTPFETGFLYGDVVNNEMFLNNKVNWNVLAKDNPAIWVFLKLYLAKIQHVDPTSDLDLKLYLTKIQHIDPTSDLELPIEHSQAFQVNSLKIRIIGFLRMLILEYPELFAPFSEDPAIEELTKKILRQTAIEVIDSKDIEKVRNIVIRNIESVSVTDINETINRWIFFNINNKLNHMKKWDFMIQHFATSTLDCFSHLEKILEKTNPSLDLSHLTF